MTEFDRITEGLEDVAEKAYRRQRTRTAIEGLFGTVLLIVGWFMAAALLTLIAALTWNVVVWVWEYAFFVDSL